MVLRFHVHILNRQLLLPVLTELRGYKLTIQLYHEFVVVMILKSTLPSTR